MSRFASRAVCTMACGSLAFSMFCTMASAQDAQGTADAPEWNQWRGPNRDSQIPGNDWPDSLGEGRLEQAWRIELGPSYSGPIVTDDRVFVTETKDKTYEVVHALDRKTGAVIWSQQWEGSMTVPFFAKENGDWIRSTPVYDGEFLYVAGMKDYVACLDGETGDVVWKVDFVKSVGSPVPSFGCSCSPIVIGEHLYIQAGAALTKLNKRTGEIVWQSLKGDGGMMDGAFSSPFYAEIHGTPQLIVQTRSSLAGVLADSGEVLWQVEVPAFRGMNILTPTVMDNMVFTSTYGGKSFMYEIGKSGDSWNCSTAWENRQQGYMSSPVVVGDYIYHHLKNRRFTCVDTRTGEETWTTTPYGKYWSMVAQGDKILALDQRGELLLIQADPTEFKLMDSRKVCDDSWAHVAISGDQIFVRELNAIAAYSWK